MHWSNVIAELLLQLRVNTIMVRGYSSSGLPESKTVLFWSYQNKNHAVLSIGQIVVYSVTVVY